MRMQGDEQSVRNCWAYIKESLHPFDFFSSGGLVSFASDCGGPVSFAADRIFDTEPAWQYSMRNMLFKLNQPCWLVVSSFFFWPEAVAVVGQKLIASLDVLGGDNLYSRGGGFVSVLRGIPHLNETTVLNCGISLKE